jgi:hypothetical protein
MLDVLLTAAVLAVSPNVETPPIARDASCDRRCQRRRRARRRKRAVVAPYDAKLNRMAWCESTGRWHIATGNGFYGGLQFTAQTWWSVGGRGYPHTNTVLEQKYRAVLLIRREGYRPWPVCGYR